MIRIVEMKQATLADYGITKEKQAGYVTYYLDGEKLLDAQEFNGIDNLANFLLDISEGMKNRNVPIKNKRDVMWRLLNWTFNDVPPAYDNVYTSGFEFDKYLSEFTRKHKNTKFSVVDNIKNLDFDPTDKYVYSKLWYKLTQHNNEYCLKYRESSGEDIYIIINLDERLMEILEDNTPSMKSSFLDKEDWIDAKDNFIERIPYLFNRNFIINGTYSDYYSHYDNGTLDYNARVKYCEWLQSLFSDLGFKIKGDEVINRNIFMMPIASYSKKEKDESDEDNAKYLFTYNLDEIRTNGGTISRKDLSPEYLGKVFDEMFNKLSF